MKGIKKIDFYKKYTNDDSISTAFGAFMSVLTLVIMIFLTLFELSKYLYPKINYKAGIIQFPVKEHENKMAFNFDIVFDTLPCACTVRWHIVFQITLQTSFLVQFIELSKSTTINAHRMTPDFKPIDSDYISPLVKKKYPGQSPAKQLKITQIQGKEACRIEGYVKVDKTSGSINFFVDLRNYENMMVVYGDDSDIINKIVYTHDVKSVTFGSIVDQTTMIRRFGVGSITDFNKADDIPKQSDINFCLYYFSLVPHMFSVGKESINKETYQYSTVYNCQNESTSSAGHQITLAYELSPVGIYYNKEEYGLLQVFTSVSAIIAGVYVIMNLVKRAIDKFI